MEEGVMQEAVVEVMRRGVEVNEQAGVLSSSRELADHHAELGEGADAVVRRVVQRPHARHEGALAGAADQGGGQTRMGEVRRAQMSSDERR